VEILTISGDSSGDSAIRERVPPRRRGWPELVAVAVILAVGIAMSAWLVMTLFGHPSPRSNDAATTPDSVEGIEATSDEGDTAQPRTRPRSLAPARPARPRKSTDTKPRATEPHTPALFREPDY